MQHKYKPWTPTPASSNPAALSKLLLLFLQSPFPQSNFTVHLPTELLIPISASHSSCPPSAQMRQITSNTWGWGKQEQLKFCPTENSSFMFSKLSSLSFQYYFSFLLSYNSNNLSSMDKANGYFKAPLHALKCQLSTTETPPSMFICCLVYLWKFSICYWEFSARSGSLV